MKLATLCYVKQGGKTLMVHRNKKANDVHKGKWNGLGGKFEPGESPEDCVIREVFEESGLKIKDPPVWLFVLSQFAHNEDWYAFVFTAHEFEGVLIDSHEGELAWIDDEELLSLPLWEGDLTFLPWLDGEQFFSAKFVYVDGKLVGHVVSFH
jgi:8-oxo-dGTP diphosphatase